MNNCVSKARKGRCATYQLVSPGLEALHVLEGQHAAAAAVVGVLYAHQRRPGAVLVIRPVWHPSRSAYVDLAPEMSCRGKLLLKSLDRCVSMQENCLGCASQGQVMARNMARCTCILQGTMAS